MKLSRKMLIGTTLAVLVMAAPLAAQARPFGHSYGSGYGPGDGYGMHRGGWSQAVPQEKQQAFYQAMEQHHEKMRPIREQIWAKNATLDALSNNPKVDPKDITALVNEIATLRNQAYAESKAFAAKMRSDYGMDMPSGGMRGYGGGYHGGYGPGGYGKRGYGGGHHGYWGGCR